MEWRLGASFHLRDSSYHSDMQYKPLDRVHFILQVTEEIEGTRFNTGISAMMEFINAAYKV